MTESAITSPLLPAGSTRDGSPFHPGEQAAQRRAGVRDLAERIGRHGIRDAMPDQHRRFFAELPFLVVGSLDEAGRPWASILTGRPGFVRSPDPRRLTIAARPIAGDPLAAALRPGAPLGLLGIQLETRRRNRMNGHVADRVDGDVTVTVDQSFGNCAKYIQARTARFVAEPETIVAEARREGPRLSAEALALVRSADTFFVATASTNPDAVDPVEGVDVSHRGGRPGFVAVETKDGASVLTVPDFSGNSFFQTFGNILERPRAGLLFVDFAAGHVLMMTGDAEVLWDAPERACFPGAERFFRVRVRDSLFVPQALPLRWSAAEPAPQLAATGTWADGRR